MVIVPARGNQRETVMPLSQRRLGDVAKRLVPPAILPLIQVYTSDSRRWNSSHRISAQNRLLQAANAAETLEALREWILDQRHSGVLIETWFAFRCFRLRPDVAFPDDDLEAAKLVIELYVRDFYCVP
jgi:hypothetical protein